MKILIHMNLSPDWADLLSGEGIEAKHWSSIGDPRASDNVIMNWAREKGCVYTRSRLRCVISDNARPGAKRDSSEDTGHYAA